MVRELLHADDQDECQSPDEARRLCTDFAGFFTSKLCRVAAEVAARMSTTAAISVALPLRPSQVAMDTLHAVSTEEVVRLIRLASPKSSPLDCMPTLLLKEAAEVMAPLLAKLA